MIKFIFAFLISLVFFTSCTVKKRAYRSGYYVEWNTSAKHATAISQTKNKTEHSKPSVGSPIAIVSEEIPDVFVSAEKEITIQKKTKAVTIFSKEDCGDVITMKTGDEIKVKVIEINEKEIKYKRCDNLEGPVITVYKNEVFMIKYANGTKEIFKEEKQNAPKPQTKTNNNGSSNPRGPQIHPLGIASILSSTIGIFLGVGPIVGIIMGAMALREINRDPQRYNGRGFAIAGIVLGALWILLLIFYLVILILFLGI